MTHQTLRSAIRRTVMAACLVAGAVAPGAVPTETAQASGQSNPVGAWNAIAGEAARAACLSPANDPLHEARMYAIAHVAIHDALEHHRPPLRALCLRRQGVPAHVRQGGGGRRRPRRPRGHARRPAVRAVPGGVRRRRHRRRRGRVRRGVGRHPRKPSQGPWHRGRSERRRGDPHHPGRRRGQRSTARRHDAKRVPGPPASTSSHRAHRSRSPRAGAPSRRSRSVTAPSSPAARHTGSTSRR